MGRRANLDASFGTRFLITVDTEEEFAWDKPFSREGHSTQSVAALRDGQAFFTQAAVPAILLVALSAVAVLVLLRRERLVT